MVRVLTKHAALRIRRQSHASEITGAAHSGSVSDFAALFHCALLFLTGNLGEPG
jgi:hypothetical protein